MTHGVVRKGHNSGNCKNPKEQHRTDATITNRINTDSKKNIDKVGWFIGPNNQLYKNKEDFYGN